MIKNRRQIQKSMNNLTNSTHLRGADALKSLIVSKKILFQKIKVLKISYQMAFKVSDNM